MYATRSARSAGVRFCTVGTFMSGWFAITWFRTVVVVPAALKRAPAGVSPWQVLHTAAQMPGPAAPGVPEAVVEATLLPTALRAVTEQVCNVPLVRPDTMIGDDMPTALAAPGLQVAV